MRSLIPREFKKAIDSSSSDTINPWLRLFRSGCPIPPASVLRLIGWRRFGRRTACRDCQAARVRPGLVAGRDRKHLVDGDPRRPGMEGLPVS